MSKEILKIERQPWMPEWATHWAVDRHNLDVVTGTCYKSIDGSVYWHNGQGLVVARHAADIEQLSYHYDHVYEIAEPHHDSN